MTNSYDITNVGIHLSPTEFRDAVSEKDNLIIYMRNVYESKVGRFSWIYYPDADTFLQAIEILGKIGLEKEKNIALLYLMVTVWKSEHISKTS
jgi:predicted sulfurtransferase